ncbi:helicase-related protein [Ancylobacter dichloromethanicus]|uniref:helicase-related protein n=1 Tax=Ancylobacter dichloromethanicus TaxID=518825 RepID=UPI003614A0D9
MEIPIFTYKFATVAVETYDLKGVENKQERLLEELGDDTHWPALVFVSSPGRVNRLAIASSKEMSVSDGSAELAHWMKENFGPTWPLIGAVEHGFGVHHARMPRALSSRMVRMFNDLDLPVLFCTSTLIEGVNTAAKTVMIYDKAIDREDFDFFTFSNIRGRAGRLGQHHVGRVLLFNEPPAQTDTDVSPTIFGDEEGHRMIMSSRSVMRTLRFRLTRASLNSNLRSDSREPN